MSFVNFLAWQNSLIENWSILFIVLHRKKSAYFAHKLKEFYCFECVILFWKISLFLLKIIKQLQFLSSLDGIRIKRSGILRSSKLGRVHINFLFKNFGIPFCFRKKFKWQSYLYIHFFLYQGWFVPLALIT